MATNVEIKARVKDFDGLARLVEALSDTPGVTLVQEDTCPYSGHRRQFYLAKCSGHREQIPKPIHRKLLFFKAILGIVHDVLNLA